MNRIHLNLATTEYYDRKSVYPAVIAGVLLVLIFSLFNIHLFTRNRAEIREYEHKISHLDTILAARDHANRKTPPAASKKETDSVKERAGFVNRLIAMDNFPWDRILDELESCTPPDILILRFTTTKDAGRFRIEGKAGSMKDVTVFLKGMDRSTLFRNSGLLNVSIWKEADRNENSSGEPSIRFEIETGSAVEPPCFRQG